MLHNKRKFLLLLLTLTILNLSSQTIFLGHKIVPSPKKTPQRVFSDSAYRAHIINKYQDLIKKKPELEEFADFQVSVKKFYLNSNTEYEKEDSAVNYLKKICEKINPFDVPLNIRIVRDPDLNACAFEDGTIYVNIGLLARYDNEAEIAAVLGHEIGHVIKQHNYKSYDIYHDIYEITFNNPYQNRGVLSTYLSAKNAFNKLVKQEEESDDISIELLKKSNYNTNALSTMVEKFMELEKKSNASIYNQAHNGLFYFRTHPATHKRYDKAQKVENNNGKNFLVDSIYFKRLKHWAIDETIYLNFLEQEFLTCIELAFNEYLKFPQDPYYLFYLTEANRRALAYYNISNIEFISGIYKKEFEPINNPNDSIYVCTDTLIKKVKRGSLNPILLKLNSSLLSFSGKDFTSYKCQQLLNEDSLEFITYADAMNYFRKVNSKNGFQLNNLFFDNACELPGLTEKEKAFQQLKCEPNALIPSESPDKKLLFVLFKVDHFILNQNMTLFDRSSTFKMSHNRRDKIIDDIQKSDTLNLLVNGEEMDFDDKNMVINYIDLISGLMDNQKEKQMTAGRTFKLLFGGNWDMMVTRDSNSINSAEVCPELITLLNKYNYKGIVFSSIVIEDQTTKGMYGTGGHMEKWKIRHYYYDLKSNKVRFYLSPNCVRADWGKVRLDLPKCFYDTVKEVSK